MRPFKAENGAFISIDVFLQWTGGGYTHLSKYLLAGWVAGDGHTQLKPERA